VGSSVVSIKTSVKANVQRDLGQEEEIQELFRKFFGIPIPKNTPNKPNKPEKPSEESETLPKGVGSGMILSGDGYILTNAHVVFGAEQILVSLTDKREFKAKIIGLDKRTDVALIKISANNLPTVKIGDVNRLKVGEWVLAIGTPFGLENTVTAGIVSAKQRDTGDYLPLIQTDVAINPGNSGGPLINMRGEVVGINSQIFSRSGGYMGISFSIPIDEAIKISDQLRATGRVSRGKLGVQIEEVTKEIADNVGLKKAQGAFVRGVESGSPAEKANIGVGDVILRVNGKAIERSSELPRLVGKLKPGTKVSVTIWSNNSELEREVTIAEFEPEDDKSSGKPADGDDKSGNAIGIKVAELTSAQKNEAKVKYGVRVTSIQANVSSVSGLQEGDIITAINANPVTSVEIFHTLLKNADKSKSIKITFRRDGWTTLTQIPPTKKE
ncbi:MAG: Do family serine endopeptidase, partial [Gammaproteobacteria bacterium]|nr:Do family serine endopeptidase [Gammaproteobacteria bacterium]